MCRRRATFCFVGNVGEEGEGDSRGAKYLLLKGKYKESNPRRLSRIDGGDQGNITNGALGSKRYRVTFKGPWRPQLRRLRHRQSVVCDGRGDCEVLADAPFPRTRKPRSTSALCKAARR
jgi:hypothetical protein